MDALETTGFRLGGIIAGGFFLALFLSALVQEYRATRERAVWAEELDLRLKRATAQLEEQLTESKFYNDLAGRLSGELRVDGVLEILLQTFLATIGLSRGVAYILGEGDVPQLAAAMGFDSEQASGGTESLVFPALPVGPSGGEVLIHRPEGGEGHPDQAVAFVPLIRAGALRGWLCGLGDVPQPFTEGVLRRLGGMAAQGISALEAARLHEEVLHMVSVNPARALYPWNGLHKLIGEEIRRSSELMFVFSLGEVQLEDYGVTTWAGDDDRDLVLRRVVKLLQNSLRRIDVISHDGAGRFVLLLSRVSKMHAVEVLRRIKQTLEEDSVAARLLEVNRLAVTVGVVTFPEDGRGVSDLLDELRDLIIQGPSTSRVRVPGP
jgi:GGDEF domain-containing protein